MSSTPANRSTMARLGADRPVSMKLTWRADTSASMARSSWESRRRCRHSRISEPNGGLWVGTTVVTGPSVAHRLPRDHYVRGNCPRYLDASPSRHERTDRRSTDTAVAAFRADLGPGRFGGLHRS